MPGELNTLNNEITLSVGANRTHAVLVVMFNGGWNKQVMITQEGIENAIHTISSTTNRPTPLTLVLEPGETYIIAPTYVPGIGQGPSNVFDVVETFGDTPGNTNDIVTHRNFRVSNTGGTQQKISITIVLVDDDVSPKA